jgi:hypothetical protein
MMTTLAASVVLLASGSAQAADPTGDWRVADGVANIRVAQCGGSMWGVVAWEKQPGGRDGNDPDVSKRSRPTLGMPILLDMQKKPGADSWEGLDDRFLGLNHIRRPRRACRTMCG